MLRPGRPGACRPRRAVADADATPSRVSAQCCVYVTQEDGRGRSVTVLIGRWLWPTLHRLNVQLRVWNKCTGGIHTPSRPGLLLTDEASFTSFLAEAAAKIDSAHETGRADNSPQLP